MAESGAFIEPLVVSVLHPSALGLGSLSATDSRWRYSATLVTAEPGGMEKIKGNLVLKEVSYIT